MNLILYLAQALMNLDSCSTGTTCFASSFSSLGAAFATEGYYAQADMLYFLTETGLSQIAGLIYLLAGFAGIMSMVLGAPPRNYVWFFIGPAVYHWLVATTVESHGVRWMAPDPDAAGDTAVYIEQQKDVWRLAEAGLGNNNYVVRNGISVKKDAPPSKTAKVSLFFVWVDDFVSDLVENFVNMSGVYMMNGSEGTSSNLDAPPNGAVKNWSILSNLKWAKLEEITAAKLRNGDVRDSFVTFLASECGDIFAKQIDESRWIAATTGKAKGMPSTVYRSSNDGPGAGAEGASKLKDALRLQAIPTPRGFANVLKKAYLSRQAAGGDFKSFSDSAPFLSDIKDKIDTGGALSCDAYLWVLLHAFRFEAGHIYYHLTSHGPGQFDSKKEVDSVVYNLFYGWGVGNGKGGFGPDVEKRKNFLMDLIFVHLIKNEFAIAPQPVDVRYAAAQESKNYVDAFARTVNSKTKYAEVYSWALMMPYIQGVIMYFLAMAYPFAALMVIVPGWHKTVFTWASFWVWIKIWDIGFAVVKVLERSIWAMIGNNSNFDAIKEKILNMSNLGRSIVTCSGEDCRIPSVTYEGAKMEPGAQGMISVESIFEMFGQAMALGANLDLDLSNGYYIYIMSALYFSVPAITGQIVLGAKAGVASMGSSMVSGFSDKASTAASTGYTGDYTQKVATNMNGSLGQAAAAKAMRASGLAHGALGEGNASLDASASAKGSETANGLLGAQSAAIERSAARAGGAVSFARSALTGGGGGAAAGGAAGASATGLLHDGAQALIKANQLDSQQAIGVKQAANTLAGHKSGIEASRANTNASRLGSAGEYDTQMAGWEAKRDAGNQMAGSAGIGGMFAASLAPGEKPRQAEGMAMSGMLDTYQASKVGKTRDNPMQASEFGQTTNARSTFGHTAPGSSFSAQFGSSSAGVVGVRGSDGKMHGGLQGLANEVGSPGIYGNGGVANISNNIQGAVGRGHTLQTEATGAKQALKDHAKDLTVVP